MPRQANGTYQQPAGTTAGPANTPISSTAQNTLIADIVAEMSNSLDRLGRGGMSATLLMNNNKISGLADPVIGTDGATKDYVDDTTSAAIAALGTASTKNTGSTANNVPLLDANGQLLNQRAAASAGFGSVTKSVGVSNESGVYFDASNNAAFIARNGSGTLRTRWDTVDPSSHLVDGYPAFLPRAWVNFNGTGTVAIRASGNVTSVTDNGIGDYTVNFASSMPDNKYSVNVTCSYWSTPNGRGSVWGEIAAESSMTTSSVRVLASSATSLNDAIVVCVTIIR